jgi:hypothetical protein
MESMMAKKKCKHPWWSYRTVNGIVCIDHDPNDPLPADTYAAGCQACGSVMPLGRSNDELADVQIEIRAAELESTTAFSIEENYGWREHLIAMLYRSESATDISVNAQWSAGWLAREIATHCEARDVNSWSWDPQLPLAEQGPATRGQADRFGELDDAAPADVHASPIETDDLTTGEHALVDLTAEENSDG